MSPRILIDATNLHVGGGVQVAASFVNELVAIRAAGEGPAWLPDSRIEVSTEIAENLMPSALATLPLAVVDTRPWSWRRWMPKRRFDVSFAVFGPEYGWSRAERRIVGYADVTSVIDIPRGVAIPRRQRAKRAVRGLVSRLLIKGADRVIVETEAFADAVRNAVPDLRARIDVVPNCVSSAVRSAGQVPPPPEGERPVRFLYVSRAYPHKNHDFLGEVGRELAKSGHRVEFWVTLTEGEWEKRTDLFRRFAHNVGVVQMEELPALHAQVDAVVFPSLLEAFSATPLEGLFLGRPVYASDRDFVRTVCGGAAVYFDPLNAAAAAAVLQQQWSPGPRRQREKAKAVVLRGIRRPRERARDYLRIVEQERSRSRGCVSYRGRTSV